MQEICYNCTMNAFSSFSKHISRICANLVQFCPVAHSALEQQYCLQKMHFWRPTPACNTYLGHHFDQVSAKSTGRLWVYLCFSFYSGNQPKYLQLWPYCISFVQKTPLKLTERNTISPKSQIFWYRVIFLTGTPLNFLSTRSHVNWSEISPKCQRL